MTDAASPVRPERAKTVAFAAMVLGTGLATMVALVVGDGDVVLVVAPAALVALAYVLAKVPLRLAASALILLSLSLDRSSDAAGLWHTPLAVVGDLLQRALERSADMPGVALSGVDVLALYLVGIALHRKATGSRIDGAGRVPAARGVVAFLLLFLAGVLFAEVVGLARGGDVAPYKLRYLLQIVLLFLVFEASFRGRRDHRTLARLVVLAASIKAILAVYVQHVAAPAVAGGKLAYATNHGDSVLFAVAAFILLASAGEHLDRRSVTRAAILLPPILLGMRENDRRIAWVMLGMMLLAAYLIGPARPWKRLATRIALVAAPIVLLYVAVGWNRPYGRLFRPVQILRTVSDASVDRSTRWRDTENWNIAMSLREHPLLGIGLGHEYTEFVKGDDISTIFPEFKGWPHNSVLGLLLLAGPFGFTAISSLFGFVVFLAVRSYWHAHDPDDRVAALTCVGTIIACTVLAYGDTGAYHVQYRLLTALALAVSVKLAVATGAWPAAYRRGRSPETRDGEGAARSSGAA